MENQRRSPLLLSIIVVGNIIWWMIMITAIGLGVMHLGSCPAQPYIPIYLIVLGVSSLFGLFLTYTQDSGEEGSVHVLISAGISVVQVFTLCWFISGTVWVYSIYPPNYSTSDDKYCQRTVYQFALYFTSLCWLLVILMFCSGACCLLSASHKIIFVRRSLSNLHHTSSYGGTSDFQECSATEGTALLK